MDFDVTITTTQPHPSTIKFSPYLELLSFHIAGRFDDAVIEERRCSALELLNFVGRQSHLYKSQIFIKFLEVKSSLFIILLGDISEGIASIVFRVNYKGI